MTGTASNGRSSTATAALAEKYRAERSKRLGDGSKQRRYQPWTSDAADLLQDPFRLESIKREPVKESCDVVIVGGGYGGLIMAVELLQAGIEDFRIVEKASDFGGTWYWNRFPGARCDVESYVYMPLLDETNYVPREKYTTGPEMLNYARSIARRFGLYDKAYLQTAVTDVTWQDGDAKWQIQTSRHDLLEAKHVVLVMGPLQRPKIPVLEGLEGYQGHVFHTARWDWPYTGGSVSSPKLTGLTDKRVGVIGTGATGVQIVPELAKWAKELYVFQRTPSSVDFRANQPTDRTWAQNLRSGWARSRADNFTRVLSGIPTEVDLVDDALTRTLGKLAAAVAANGGRRTEEVQELDYQIMEKLRERVESLVKAENTAAALKPYYHLNCKRPCYSDTYLQAFNQPNVHLVDTHGRGVERVTPRGVIVGGEEIELDCIIFASGFEFTSSYKHKHGMDITGRNGLSLNDKWGSGMMTLFGQASHGFPNLWHIQPFQAGLSQGNTLVARTHAENIAYIICKCRRSNVRCLEPTQEAEDAWVQGVVDAKRAARPMRLACTPGYLNDEGRESIEALRLGFLPLMKWQTILQQWRVADKLEGFEVQYDM